MSLTGDAKREYDRKWMAERRTAWFAVNGPCIDCGSWENLEIDHVDRFEKISHRIWSWSTARREAELSKCVVRCSTCHDIRSAQQLAQTICKYGHDMTVLGYDNYGKSKYGNGSCSECRRERHRQARKEGRKK